MSGQHQCSLTATIQTRSPTALVLRLVSILHSRGAEVHALSFESRDDLATMTAHVTLGNVGWPTLRLSLLRPVEVIDVVGPHAVEPGSPAQPTMSVTDGVP